LETSKPPPVSAPQAQPTPTRLSEAAEAWDRTKDTVNVAILEAFIARYKGTFYVDLAQARIEELKKQQVTVASPPVRPAVPPKADPPKPAVAISPTPARCDGVEALFSNERRCLKPKDSFQDCPGCPEMVVVPAGEFTMGSPPNEAERGSNEGPQRKVTLAKPFGVGKFEVTFAEWDTCVAAASTSPKMLPGARTRAQ
jgi:formylglycine-generating enzyme required for sulfatase activity